MKLRSLLLCIARRINVNCHRSRLHLHRRRRRRGTVATEVATTEAARLLEPPATWVWSANLRRPRWQPPPRRSPPPVGPACVRTPPPPVLKPAGGCINNNSPSRGGDCHCGHCHWQKLRPLTRPPQKRAVSVRLDPWPSRRPTCTTCTNRSPPMWPTPGTAPGPGSGSSYRSSSLAQLFVMSVRALDILNSTFTIYHYMTFIRLWQWQIPGCQPACVQHRIRPLPCHGENRQEEGPRGINYTESLLDYLHCHHIKEIVRFTGLYCTFTVILLNWPLLYIYSDPIELAFTVHLL